jgi:hypothetical protein
VTTTDPDEHRDFVNLGDEHECSCGWRSSNMEVTATSHADHARSAA